jgi:testis-specific serine kinase
MCFIYNGKTVFGTKFLFEIFLIHLLIKICGRMPYDDSNIKRMIKAQIKQLVEVPKKMMNLLDNEAINLIDLMLQPDVKLRSNIDSVLSHKWFQK